MTTLYWAINKASRRANCKFYIFSHAYNDLSHDVASGSDITLCNKIFKPLVVYRFTGNVMTSITTLRT